MALVTMANNTASRNEKSKRRTTGASKAHLLRSSTTGQFVEVSTHGKAASGGPDFHATLIKSYRDLKAGVRSQMVRDLERDHIVERSDVRMIIPDRTLDRRISAGEPLKPEEADGIARLVRIVTYARKVFTGEDMANEWLRSPNPELDNEVPIRMSATDLGAREVEAVLGRIEHGVFG